MDSYTCPKGHISTEPDFCSECGTKMQAAPAAPASVIVTAPPAAVAGKCPDCGAARVADGSNFCEVCGYNFSTGAHGEIPVAAASSPAPAPAAKVTPPASAPGGAGGFACPASQASQQSPDRQPQAPSLTTAVSAPQTAAAPAAAPQTAARWTILIAVDPSLRETGSPEPPAGVGPFTIHLDQPMSLIGRRSESRAIFPEIPLNYDDAVSHRHALLQRGADGSLSLRDIGASNGTRLNGKAVQPLVDIPMKDGDEITLGHWTRITVKAG